MAASLLIPPTTQIVTQTVAATGPGTAFSLKFAEAYYAEALATAAAGTVDVALQHSTDNGATWQTLPLKFGQISGAGVSTALSFKPAVGLSDAATAFTTALTGAPTAANIPFNVKMVRPYFTLGTAGTTTVSLRFTATPKGGVVQ